MKQSKTKRNLIIVALIIGIIFETWIVQNAMAGIAITQTFRIAKNGEVKLETLSLSTNEWESFLKSNLGDGAITISDLEIDRLFIFEEIDPEYPSEVVEFLRKDKDPLTILSSRFLNIPIFFDQGFLVSYKQQTELIEVTLETESDFVKFEITGVNGKKLYCGKQRAENGIQFLIFNKGNNLFAINEEMRMFQLIPR